MIRAGVDITRCVIPGVHVPAVILVNGELESGLIIRWQCHLEAKNKTFFLINGQISLSVHFIAYDATEFQTISIVEMVERVQFDFDLEVKKPL